MKIQRNVANFMRRNGPNVMGYNNTLISLGKRNTAIVYTHNQEPLTSPMFFTVKNDELTPDQKFTPFDYDIINHFIKLAVGVYEAKNTPKIAIALKSIKQHDKYNATLNFGNNYIVDTHTLPFFHRILSVNTWKTKSAIYALPQSNRPVINFSFLDGELQFFLPVEPKVTGHDVLFATS